MARTAADVDLRRNDGTTEVKRSPETKTFLATSEFWVMAIAIAALAFAGYVIDDITNATTWKYGTWIAIAYIVSRGIAKAGSQRTHELIGRDDPAYRDQNYRA